MRDPTVTGGGVCQCTDRMFAYHSGACDGSAVYVATSSTARSMTVSTVTSTAISRSWQASRRTESDSSHMNRGAAVVTGAGGGLGAGIARRLGRDGWSIGVNDVDEAAAQSVAAQIA